MRNFITQSILVKQKLLYSPIEITELNYTARCATQMGLKLISLWVHYVTQYLRRHYHTAYTENSVTRIVLRRSEFYLEICPLCLCNHTWESGGKSSPHIVYNSIMLHIYKICNFCDIREEEKSSIIMIVILFIP